VALISTVYLTFGNVYWMQPKISKLYQILTTLCHFRLFVEICVTLTQWSSRYDFTCLPIVHSRYKREFLSGKAKERSGPFTRSDLILSSSGILIWVSVLHMSKCFTRTELILVYANRLDSNHCGKDFTLHWCWFWGRYLPSPVRGDFGPRIDVCLSPQSLCSAHTPVIGQT